jgi:Saccharopine dehydrogenase and related proteins
MNKILLIGGTGIAGRCILDYLKSSDLPVEIDVASRGNYKLPDSIGQIRLDVTDQKELRKAVGNYEMVIVATGPFKKYGASIHKACVENKVCCIDINDELSACEQVFELREQALENQTGIYTGMGLAPGLTTFLLQLSAERLSGPVTEAGLRICFGAGVRSGKGSIENIFSNFGKYIRVIRNNKPVTVNASRQEKNSTFTFDPDHADLPLYYYSAPETYTLFLSPRFKHIQRYDAAFYLQNLPAGLVRFLRSVKVFKKPICRSISNAVYNQQYKVSETPENEKLVIVKTFVRDSESTVTCTITHPSSFELTAAFCAIVTEYVLLNGSKPGVFSFEMLSPDSDQLVEALKKKGITISVEKERNETI